jgi:hypothetical protein
MMNLLYILSPTDWIAASVEGSEYVKILRKSDKEHQILFNSSCPHDLPSEPRRATNTPVEHPTAMNFLS